MKRAQKHKQSDDVSSTFILEEEIGFQLRLASRRYARSFLRNMKIDLTPTQFATLAYLHTIGACSQNELGRRTGVDTSSIVRVIERLKDRRLVSVSRDKSDNRRIVIALTPSGRDQISRVVAIERQANDDTLAPLTVRQREKLILFLRKIAFNPSF